MTTFARHCLRTLLPGFVVVLCLTADAAAATPAPVDTTRLRAADSDATQWLMDGRNYMAQRFSPLKHINESNVSQLGLAWYAELDTYRGVEGTPLFVDGVLYNISAWNITTAYNAKTGRRLWTYDPQVPREWGRYACCEPVARGLAFWKGKVIIATLDGRLIGLNAKNGKLAWTVQTFEKDWPYSITGAPRVFDGIVVVGNGGADLGVRGFVSAWTPRPANSCGSSISCPAIHRKVRMAQLPTASWPWPRKTWSGEWWKWGGGGTAWDSIAYDPELQTVYVGTGNGGPDAQLYRSPLRGDNLFLCSIVALDAKTGAYKWHYQEVPEEDWGLHLHAIHRAGRSGHRRQAAQGADACAEERLLLRDRPHQRPVHPCEEPRFRHVDQWPRPGDGPTGHESGSALRHRSRAGCTRTRRRPQLVSDGVQPGHGARVLPAVRTLVHLRAGSELQAATVSAPMAAGAATVAMR